MLFYHLMPHGGGKDPNWMWWLSQTGKTLDITQAELGVISYSYIFFKYDIVFFQNTGTKYVVTLFVSHLAISSMAINAKNLDEWLHNSYISHWLIEELFHHWD